MLMCAHNLLPLSMGTNIAKTKKKKSAHAHTHTHTHTHTHIRNILSSSIIYWDVLTHQLK